MTICFQDEASVLIEEIIEVFLQTLLTVLHKKQPSDKFTLKYVPFTQLPEIEEVSKINLIINV